MFGSVRLKPYPYDSGDIKLMDRTLLIKTKDKKASDLTKRKSKNQNVHVIYGYFYVVIL